MPRRAAFTATLALLAAFATATPLRAQDLGILLGAAAPNADVVTLAGAPASLSAYIGKTPTLIEFWATWCPNCKELEPAMTAAAHKYGSQVKFVRIAVTVNESRAHVQAFVKKYGIPGDHFYDAHGDATQAYDAPATSYVVLLDRTGKVVYTGLGGKQDLEAAIKKVL
jgi:thiol-disulfide isomerase/thioredoxin